MPATCDTNINTIKSDPYPVEVFTNRISIWISIWSWINAGYGSDFIVLMDMDMDNGYGYSELDLHNL